MDTLLLVAHGSRRETSNEEVRKLAVKVQQAAKSFSTVSCAFLELAEPSIPDGIRQCFDSGAESIIVLPCFLSMGRHVAIDIPDEIASVQKEYPEKRIAIAPHIGASDDLISLILNLAEIRND